MTARAGILLAHRVLGVGLALLLLGLFLSGALLLARAPLEDASDPMPAVIPGPARVSLEALVTAAERRVPLARPVELRLPSHAAAPARVVMLTPGRDRVEVLVDPYTGVAIGARWPGRSALSALRLLHVELHLGAWGRGLVACLGLGLAVQGVTGLVLSWAFLRRPGRGLAIRRGRPWAVIAYDTHKALGAITLLFNLAMGTSGALLAIALVTAPGGPGHAHEELAASTLDAAARAATTALPGAALLALVPDPRDDGIVVARMRLPCEADPRGQSFARVVQKDGRLVGLRPAYRASWVERVEGLAVMLHYGEFAGAASQGVYALGALAAMTLVVTGVAVWLGRGLARGGRPRG